MNSIHSTSPLLRMDLNLFRVFATIYREGNLARAAEQLSLSPSAVSHALARLRQHLDDPLFERSAQGMVPTSLAHRLWPDINQALGGLERSVVRHHSFQPSRDLHTLTLALNTDLETMLLPLWLMALQREAPQVVVNSVRSERSTLKKDLATGELDFAVDVAHPVDPSIQHFSLFDDQLVVLGPQQEALTVDHYLSASHIAVSSRRTGRSLEDLELARLGLERQVAIRCQQYPAAMRLAQQLGYQLTLPRRLAEYLLSRHKGENLYVHPMPLALSPFQLHVYWHSSREHDPASQWLRELLRTALQDSAITLREL